MVVVVVKVVCVRACVLARGCVCVYRTHWTRPGAALPTTVPLTPCLTTTTTTTTITTTTTTTTPTLIIIRMLGRLCVAALLTTTLREQNPRPYTRAPQCRVQTGDWGHPVLCFCKLGHESLTIQTCSCNHCHGLYYHRVTGETFRYLFLSILNTLWPPPSWRRRWKYYYYHYYHYYY